MKLAICNIAVLLATFAFTSSTRILVGHPEKIYVADIVEGFPFSLERAVVGIPSWMVFSHPNLLYAVDESSNNVKVFNIDLDNHEVTLRAIKRGSSGVVHLQFNKNHTRLIGSAYGNGTIDVWNSTDGRLELMKTIASPGQLGPHKERQTSPHPHQANLDPTGRFFVINDLGTDSIITIDSRDDEFKVVNTTPVLPRGCGPRHGVFYPQNAFLATHYFVVCEISNQVLVYTVSYSQNVLNFKQIQKISTLGPDCPPVNATSAAAGAIVLAANNKDLYISNRQTGN